MDIFRVKRPMKQKRQNVKRIALRLLAETVRPIVEEIRQAVFGQAAPPFSPKDLASIKDPDRSWRLLRQSRQMETHPRFRAISDLTGWDKGMSRDYIFTGQIPARGHLIQAGTLGIAKAIPHVSVTLWPWSLSQAGLTALARDVRRLFAQAGDWAPSVAEWLPRRGRRGSAYRYILASVIADIGSLPERGRMQYWQRLADRWREVTGSPIQPDTIRKAYMRGGYVR